MSVDNSPFIPDPRQERPGLGCIWTFITWPLTQLRETYDRKWANVMKIFSRVFLQLLISATVATCILHDKSAANFFDSTWIGLIVYLVIILFVPASLILNYRQNYFSLLIVFVLALGSTLGLLVCLFPKVGNVIQQTLIVATAAFAGLVLYAFFASFISILRYMFAAFIWGSFLIIGLLIASQKRAYLIWSWLLLGGLSFNYATVGAVLALAICGHVAWDTKNLVFPVRRQTCCELVLWYTPTDTQVEPETSWASMQLYLDFYLYVWPIIKFILSLVKEGKKNER